MGLMEMRKDILLHWGLWKSNPKKFEEMFPGVKCSPGEKYPGQKTIEFYKANGLRKSYMIEQLVSLFMDIERHANPVSLSKEDKMKLTTTEIRKLRDKLMKQYEDEFRTKYELYDTVEMKFLRSEYMLSDSDTIPIDSVLYD